MDNTVTQFNKIIKELSEDKLFKHICRNNSPNKYLKDELYQEFFLTILEYNKQKIIDMYNKKQLTYFCIGLIKKMIHSNTSPFYTKIRKQYIKENEFDNETYPMKRYTAEVDDTEEIREKQINDMGKIDRINKILDNEERLNGRFFYKRKLFEMYYLNEMSYRDIEKHTHIPHVSVFWAVKEVKDLLKKELGL